MLRLEPDPSSAFLRWRLPGGAFVYRVQLDVSVYSLIPATDDAHAQREAAAGDLYLVPNTPATVAAFMQMMGRR